MVIPTIKIDNWEKVIRFSYILPPPTRIDKNGTAAVIINIANYFWEFGTLVTYRLY